MHLFFWSNLTGWHSYSAYDHNNLPWWDLESKSYNFLDQRLNHYSKSIVWGSPWGGLCTMHVSKILPCTMHSHLKLPCTVHGTRMCMSYIPNVAFDMSLHVMIFVDNFSSYLESFVFVFYYVLIWVLINWHWIELNWIELN